MIKIFIKIVLVAVCTLLPRNTITAVCTTPGYSVDGVTGKCLLPGYTTGGGGLGGLTPFIMPFKYIQELAPDSPTEKTPQHYTLSFNQFKQNVHSELPDTLFWGYGDADGNNSVTPGKMIVQPIGTPFSITYKNNLPKKHIFSPFLPEIPDTQMFMAESRGVVHFHGLPNTQVADGLPLEWINPGQSTTLLIPNPTTRTVFSFYHDHSMMITRLNMYSGLAGGWLMKDPNDTLYNLPAGLNVYDVPILIQDRSFYTDGSLNFNINGFNYDYPMVNGVIAPYLEVEPRKYIFRLLNGCQSSFLGVAFTTDATLADLSNVPFKIIGGDGGFLDKTINISAGSYLPIAPAEKYWVVVDFSGYTGQNIVMTNQDPTGIFPGIAAYQNTMGSYFSGYPGTFTVNNRIMQCKVTLPLSGTDTSTTPTTFLPKAPSSKQLIKQASYTRNLVIDGSGSKGDGGYPAYDAPTITGDTNTPFMVMVTNYHRWNDPVTEMPLLGSTEIWNYISNGTEIHPFHTHLVFFRTLDRRAYDEEKYTADRLAGKLKPLQSYVTGPTLPPQPWENGLKETVQCPQGYITRIAMTWGPYAQNLMYHCHILDHEDFDMMRPLSVLPKKTYFYDLTKKYDQGDHLPSTQTTFG